MLSSLELKVVAQILSEEASQYPELERQMATLVVQSREYTGTGVFINFRQPDPNARCGSCPDSMRLGQEVAAHLGSNKIMAGFVLYVESGEITTLEGFTYGEAWPEDADDEFEIR
ncbi:hypothetical protein HNR42_003504 [Deinobacterium chartae]|uniref:Uncharacterized protein n=1 Tax=Deinobacterium chartae TaxID=521158 RepID=A0A841I749_9DEIO|nr:hypothetical protein [Deinobacterium chartae]MBB6100039.1 hypothetical protein [Deinobacterium chartae]